MAHVMVEWRWRPAFLETPVLRTAMMILGAVLVALLLLGVGFLVANWAPDRPVSALVGRWAPPPSQFVDIAGMKVHLRDEGPRDDPSPIILIHGTGSYLHAWEGWVLALKEQRRVITFDLPGFGLTGPSPDGDYSLEATVRFVTALMDKLGVAHGVIGGNSLGGAISWAMAVLEPSRVDKLILVDAGGYPAHSTSIPLGFRVARIPGLNQLLSYTLPRFLIDSGMRNVFGDPNKVTDLMVDRAYEITLREGNRQAMVDRFNQPRRTALAGRIPEIKVPTLIIWGGRDRLIPPDDAERFHRDIAGSTVVVFDDLGHAPEEEDPARSVAAVKQFLGLH
jgi:pimeloyl-ACP methyl ester carboxylesterase